MPLPAPTRVARIAAIVLLGVCAAQAIALLAPPAPFAQLYRDATPAQDAAVTRQLAATLIGLPLGLLLLVAAWRVGAARRCAFAGAVTLVTALAAILMWGALPYGFGSGDEHLSAAQALHLQLVLAVAGAGAGLGVLLLGTAAILGAKHTGAVDAPIDRRPSAL